MNEHHRPVRSFVRREGRMTAAQQRALQELSPQYALPDDNGEVLDLDTLFGRGSERWLEIGCGNGDALVSLATQHPERDFIGIEVHRPGVGHLLGKLAENGCRNARIASEDAVEVLQQRIPDASLAAVLLWFPDPWPKKRHHKRRIVNPAFVELVCRKLRSGGFFHLATDWEEYAQWMVEVLESSPGLRNRVAPGAFTSRPEWRIETRFERRGLRLGHAVFDLIYEKP